ncbi:MAG: DUF4279 domain-containing protein, partial [Christensenellaceae bacterium]|nr:DUF4279 domain-containing protein [Christensenellaceae bacterium]
RLLGFTPFETHRMDEPRKNGRGTYPFSDWSGCRQDAPAYDAGLQVLRIAEMLRPKADLLKDLKDRLQVDFSIIVVPQVCPEDLIPSFAFSPQVHTFCHEVGAQLSIDLYVHS